MMRDRLARAKEIWKTKGWRILSKKALARLQQHALSLVPAPLDRIVSTWILDQHKKDESQCHDAIDTAYTFIGVGRFTSLEPIQEKDELECFMSVLQTHEPTTFLEIGTARGGTLYSVARCVSSLTHIISIDLPGGRFGGGYTSGHPQFFASFQGDVSVTCIRRSSHSSSALRSVTDALGDEPLDALLIDGDHTFDGVKADYHDYTPLVRNGGIIALHDIVPDPEYPDIEVPAFWNRVSTDRHSKVISSREAGGGYGLLRKSDDAVLQSF